ncbi:YbaB/EbfC family nucleoid-associated protein [Micromonospora sp. NPDC000316]|uniref:YbaB/EbfC family nucleoid-associated protein n=1 Tax=Micromonospora sp. NPDC000316 TaxID=3364216 RepID=UPI003678277A
MNEFVERFLETSERYYRSDSAPEKLTEAARDFQAGLTELMSQTASATDRRGYVEATVSLGRTVVTTYISPRALRDLDAGELGEACVEAIAAARLVAAEQFTAQVGDFPDRLTHLDPAELIRRGRV